MSEDKVIAETKINDKDIRLYKDGSLSIDRFEHISFYNRGETTKLQDFLNEGLKKMPSSGCTVCGKDCEFLTMRDKCCPCSNYPKSKYCPKCQEEHMIDLSGEQNNEKDEEE